MSAKNKARKSTGTRASSRLTSTPSNSSNQTLRQRGSATRRNSPDSDDDEQSTLLLPNSRRNQTSWRDQAAESSSDTTSDSDEAPGRIKTTTEKDKRKKRRVVRRGNSSPEASDEDAIPSTSTASSTSRGVSRSNKTASSPSETTLKPGNFANLVNKCVYYLLIADQKKCVIKKKDILKHVFTAQENKFYSDVMKEVHNILHKTYGLEILTFKKRAGEYLLFNVLGSKGFDVQQFIELPAQELQKRGFIFYLLTVIFMNENSITDDELATALKPLGIDLKKPHPTFGDVSKYLKELASQQYIERREISKDPPQCELVWGERAHMEVNKRDLLEFVCQIMGDTTPKDWILQYNDAMSSRQDNC